MIPRYTTPEMANIWSDAEKFETWFEIELAAVQAWEKKGVVPPGTSADLKKRSQNIDWLKLSRRALEIEETTRHDVIAFLSALEEELGENTKWIHLGMTSSDVVDTAFALLLKKSSLQVLDRLIEFKKSLSSKAREYKNTVCLGRTHGQAAEITTFGLKLLTYVAEMSRNEARLRAAIDEISHGKLSGAVGNYGNIEPEIEADVMKSLGLDVEPISTQIVPRDRHAVLFSTFAVIAGGVERLAVEIRHLMRTEVSEAFEPFKKGQKGSSAMPHKKNPILTENVTGLARLIRNYAGVAFENQALWHERDISHSSAERVIAPDATTALDFALHRMGRVIEGLVVDKEKMLEHIESTGGLVFSEGILLSLVKKGVMRQEAYVWVQRAAMSSRQGQGTFADNLKSDPDVKKYLGSTEIDRLFDPKSHLKHVDEIFDRVM